MPSPDPNLYPQSNIDRWAFRPWHVGLDMGGKNTNAITPENVFLAAGPARLSDVNGDFSSRVMPLGVIEQVSVGQQKSAQPVREIGSRRSYIIGSYATGQLSLSKVMFAQRSLLSLLTVANGDDENLDNPIGPVAGSPFAGQDSVRNLYAERILSINMQAEVLDRPIGMLFYILDQRNQPYGAFYVEDLILTSHNFALAAQGIAISEQVSGMFDRALPVQVLAAA